MVRVDKRDNLESLIEQWRSWVGARGMGAEEVATGERTLRAHAASLSAGTPDPAEAFLVALTRVAETDDATRAYLREYADELWPKTVGAAPARGDSRSTPAELWVVLACAAAAALALKAPELFGYRFGDDMSFYARNLSFFCLPLLAVYFIWKRGLTTAGVLTLGGTFTAAAVFANAYPFTPGGSTEVLTAIHLPIALWLAIGVAYVGGEWRNGERRMEYVRFTGEWLVSYALIGLGGGVLVALSAGIFQAVGVDIEPFIEGWLPSAAMASVIVAAWLADSRRGILGGFAPTLARVFTPLFALMLAAALVAVAFAGGIISVERETLILFDLLLVVVLALLLYAVSARDRLAGPGLFDWIQLALVAAALAVDVFALVNIAGRLAEFGFSANRTAALGLNLILLVNLAWSAFLQTGFLRARHGFEQIESWQMRYLPVYAIWAALVVVAFPLLFGFA